MNQLELIGSKGSYYATPYHDKKDNLVGFGIATGDGRLDYVISKSDFNDFTRGIDNYRSAADALHQNGAPSENMIAYISAFQDGNLSGMAQASLSMWSEPGATANAVLSSLAGIGGGLAIGGGSRNTVRNIDDVLANPNMLKNMDPAIFKKNVTFSGKWVETSLGKGSNKGSGYKVYEVGKNGKPTGRQIRYNPGSQSGRKDGDSYWRVVNYDGKSQPIKN